ncbi:MAG TPA: hypothetical protein VIJ38_03270 [Acidobacteriaceae bacterium]
MLSIATLFLFGNLAIAQSSPAQHLEKKPLTSASTSPSTATLPPDPKGKSTVMGGEIQAVDPVRDQLTLKVFGGKAITILFDERTKVYRNGARIPIFDLHPDEHASVETALDGTTVFALSIHMLSHLPGDELRGQVSSYNARTGSLTVQSNLSHEPITVRVPAGIRVVSISPDGVSTPETGSIHFVPGTLLNVRFKGSKTGQGIATGIDVLAVPGSSFVFSGRLSLLNLLTGRMVITDPRDNKAYPISFDPSHLPVTRTIHQGMNVKVTTNYDGIRYTASEVVVP